MVGILDHPLLLLIENVGGLRGPRRLGEVDVVVVAELVTLHSPIARAPGCGAGRPDAAQVERCAPSIPAQGRARAAARAHGVEPASTPIRGGTDGSLLTELGTPTPNIFTGQQNVHGPLEWISVQDMALATDVALTLVQLATQKQ